MDLKELFEKQIEFDSKRPGWERGGKSPEETVQDLVYDTIGISGEIGEFANIVKKILRNKNHDGTMPTEEQYAKLREELVDVFIYLMKLSLSLGGDLEEDYFKKLEYNDKRFAKFVK